MIDYYCLISIANDRICSICRASFRNFTISAWKGGKKKKDFFWQNGNFCHLQQIRSKTDSLCVYVRTHDAYSDFGGADDTAKAETLPKSDRVTVLMFHSEDCLSY